ncbi:virulence-associated E family protein [uncultured Phocaeicola sp.]|uniref:virulence-associated E family protein n=1 Tax=uncultured Phocaeicola sp. TaxID=990718 RepID=UPI002624BFE8|nr:virulence-associated E family protein [uncultured Phocaeicola sp.]
MQKDKNVPIQSRKNCVTVLGVDPALCGKIKFNTLSNRKSVEGALPWNKSEQLRDWTNIDTEYLLYYMETYYLLNSDKKILSALEMVADVNKFNPFVDMLNSITWDGVPRIENLLTDYLGVEKTRYTTECMKLLMLAVISRAFCPGTKFDYVIVISGPQGIGKSTFFMKLCCNDEWYLENLKDIVRGKDSGELLQGKIIVEFNELLAFKSSVENIKSFVTLTADEYRGSYERETEKRRRTCVFVGTTNTSQFLVDKTGNRRFLPMDCGVVSPTKSLFADDEILSYEFKQAWAEAYQIYKSGKFSLTMPRDLEDYIESLQEDYKEDDPLVGVIQNWLNSHDDDYTCNIQIAEKALGICEKPDKRTINQIAEIMNNSVSGRKELHTDLLNMVSKDVTSGNVVKTDFVTWNKMKLLKNHCHSLNSLPMLLIVTVIVTAESAYL